MAETSGQVRDEELSAEAEARRRVALAQIRQYPDPALRLRAGEIETFDDDLLRLVERMAALMREANGVGLAANQVGVLRRVFVFQRAEREVAAVVNPVLAVRSEELETVEEGCLSLQGVRVPVERHLEVTLEGVDERGEPVRLELAEAQARIAQHELDHLDGVLILDRTTREDRSEALGVLRADPVLPPLSIQG